MNESVGEAVSERITLRDGSGVEVELVDLGAAVDVIRAPDRHGTVAAITLSLPDDARPDPDRNPFVGVTIGPYANRLVVDNEIVLHGGPAGWSWRRWDLIEATDTRAVFTHGQAQVTYELADGVLDIVLQATSDRDTVLSMANHTYWNLGGGNLGGPVAEHDLTVSTSSVV